MENKNKYSHSHLEFREKRSNTSYRDLSLMVTLSGLNSHDTSEASQLGIFFLLNHQNFLFRNVL